MRNPVDSYRNQITMMRTEMKIQVISGENNDNVITHDR